MPVRIETLAQVFARKIVSLHSHLGVETMVISDREMTTTYL